MLVTKPEYAPAVKALPEAGWVKPNRSGPVSDNCLEVAKLGGGRVALRDSTNPTAAAIVLTADEWRAFVGSARDGQYDD